MKIEIKNLSQFTKWTENVVKEVESKVKNTVNQNVHQMEGQAKMLAPVDTGHLRQSINTELSNGGMTGEVSTNVEYALFVEYGTSRQAAQPFMYPAFVMYSKNFESEIRKIVRDVK